MDNSTTCSFTECERANYCKGYCKAHYTQAQRGRELTPIGASRTRICSFQGCVRKHGVKGLCLAHDAQRRSGKDLHPIGERVVTTCRGPECVRVAAIKGLCESHNMQMRRQGELKPLAGPALTVESRFWQKVRRTDDCWDWIGAKTEAGYGLFGSSECSSRLAHRYSHWLATGEEPEHVDHLCHNTSCVRPTHLRSATVSQNLQNRQKTASKGVSGYRNVYPIRKGQRGKPWVVRLSVHGRTKHIGQYATVEEANNAAIAARKQYYPYSQW